MRSAWQFLDSVPLGPRTRAMVIFVVAAAIAYGLLAVTGESGPLGILLAIWAGFFADFVFYRLGYFAERVRLLIPGDDQPQVERMRRTMGKQRLVPGAEASYIGVQEANNAEDEVDAEDRVLGIEVEGHAIAYPLAAMGQREIAHEVMGGKHIFVTWWPVTYSARAFVVNSGNQIEPDLKVIRKTLLNSSVMHDHTGSEIVQFNGQAVTGPLAGQSLEQIPVVSTNWRAWSGAHPQTEVMSLDGTNVVDTFEKYYMTDRAGLYQQSARDRRWHDKDNVLGISVNGRYRCYPYPVLLQRPLINEQFNGEQVLVAHERLSGTAVVFSRVVNGQTLTFSGDSRNPMRPTAGPGDDDDIRRRINYEPWFLVDSQTGSRWRAVSGECVSGELKGARLRPLNGMSGFWFAWSRFFPGSDVLEATRSKDGSE